MSETVQFAAAIAAPVVGALVWLIRLEGRVNVHDSILSDIRDDVAYIRQRLDAAAKSHTPSDCPLIQQRKR